MISKEELQNNVQEIEANIDKALKKACKSRNDLTLVAVTKIHPVELLKMALETGLTVLGESKVQEALNKQEEIGQSAEWHLIGHLQTNKVKHAVGKFSIIHSVDSLKLANEIQKQCKKKEIIQNILIQVNISKEDSKFGNTPEETIALMKEIALLPNLKIQGLMTIGLFTDDEEEIRREFRLLKGLFDKIKSMTIPEVEMKYLSMGMTNDYEIAIEEGSNMVRIGTALFGQRNY